MSLKKLMKVIRRGEKNGFLITDTLKLLNKEPI